MLVASALFGAALGVAAATMALFEQIALRALPVPAPDELAVIAPRPRRGVWRGNSPPNDKFSYSHFTALREGIQPIARLAAVGSFDTVVDVQMSRVSSASGPLVARLVSGNYFEVLGARPALGRLIDLKDEANGSGACVAVLSHHAWSARFGGVPSVIGSVLMLQGAPCLVVGVVADGFYGESVGRAPDLWLPLSAQAVVLNEPSLLEDSEAYWLLAFARLMPRVPRDAVQERLQVLYRNLQGSATLGPVERAAVSLVLGPGERGWALHAETAGRAVLAVFGMEVLLCLTAGLAAGGLLLTSLQSRRQELATRMALGATRLRLLKDEFRSGGLMMAWLGLVAALVAWVTWRWALVPLSIRLLRLTFDGRPDSQLWTYTGVAAGLGAALLLVVATAGLLGVAPASVLSTASASRRGRSGRPGTVGAGVQVGLTLAIGYTALLLQATVLRMRAVDIGVDSRDVLIAYFDLSTGPRGGEHSLIYPAILDAARSIPGVDLVALSSSALLSDSLRLQTIAVAGQQDPSEPDRRVVVETVTSDYFKVLGIPVLGGRTFTRDGDTIDGVVVNSAFVSQFLAGHAVLGTQVQLASQARPVPILAVVGNVRHHSLRSSWPAMVYLPAGSNGVRLPVLQIRARANQPGTAALVTRRLTQRGSYPRLSWLRTLDAQIRTAMAFETTLGALATWLTAFTAGVMILGLYSLSSYRARQQNKNLAIRVALGASAGDVIGQVALEACLTLALGVPIGTVLAYCTTRAMSAIFFDVAVANAAAATIIVLLTLLALVVAMSLPSLKALGRLDIARILRQG